MSTRPIPQPGILTIAPYVPGRSSAQGHDNPIKLSANESPLGASPKAIAAYRTFAEKLEIYPEGSSRLLREALGQANSINPDNIVVGAGSDEILHLLAQTYIGDGDEAIMSQYGFNVYPIITQAAGGTIIMAPEADFNTDIDAILAAITDKTKIIFIANPNNPTGTYLSSAEIERLHAGVPAHVLLVIDNAYAEYVTADDYSIGSDLVEKYDNVVMVRTFSKMGLAGLRIGWLYGPAHLVDAINRIRGPFNISTPAQAAGAAAALDDDFNAQLKSHNAQWRDWLTAELASNALRVIPSQGNFILVFFPQEEGRDAKAAFNYLLSKGLIVREMGGYNIPHALRISIGPADAMKAVASALKDFIQGSL